MKRREETAQPSDMGMINFILIMIISKWDLGRRCGEVAHLQMSGNDCCKGQRTSEWTSSTEHLQIRRVWNITHSGFW